MGARSRALPLAASLAVHAALGAWLFTRAARAPDEVPAKVAPSMVALHFAPKVEPKVEGPAPSREAGEAPKPRRTGPKRAPIAGRRAQGGARASEGGPEQREVEGHGGRAAGVEGTAGDGSVEAKPGRAIDLALHPVRGREPPPAGLGDTPGGPRRAEGEGADARRLGLRASGGGTYEYEDPEFRARIHHDGTVEIEDRYHGPEIGMDDRGRPKVSIAGDLTDLLLRLLGEDPYAYEKNKVMRRTRGMREKMADESCREDLREALLRIRPGLEALWREERLTSAERRRRIFQLWDQCVEDGSPDVIQASEQIRAAIVAFVQEKLPASSALAYSPSELTALNDTRRSRARFAPYE